MDRLDEEARGAEKSLADLAAADAADAARIQAERAKVGRGARSREAVGFLYPPPPPRPPAPPPLAFGPLSCSFFPSLSHF